MTTVDPTSSSTGRPVWRMDWIIGKRTDLIFFIGAALGGYAFFFLHIMHQAWHIDMLLVYFLWLALIDAPHFFDTYSRTYFDRQEMKSRRRLLLCSIGFLAVGPLVLTLCYVLFKSGSPNYYAPYAALGGFVGVWAYWHVVRQHYGVMSLYKRKNQDFAKIDRWLDNSLLYAGTLAPFVALAFRHQDARREVASLSIAVLSFFGWSHADAMDWFGRTADFVFRGSVVVVITVAALFVARQIYRVATRQVLNLPKLLFFAAVVPLHAFVLYHPAVLSAQLILVAAFVTIFHDFQYHAIVWHYQRNRCHAPDVDGAKYGLATKLSSNPFVFFGCAIMMGLVGGYIGCNLDVVPGCTPMIRASSMQIFGTIYAQEFFASIMLGFLMHHYFVDQFIWRPSKDRKLREDLRINS